MVLRREMLPSMITFSTAYQQSIALYLPGFIAEKEGAVRDGDGEVSR